MPDRQLMTETKNATGTSKTETSERQDPIKRDNKGTLIAFLVAIALFFLFVQLGDTNRGVAAGVVGLVIVATIRSRWDLRRRVWFCAMMAVLTLAHVPLILLVHWPYTGNMPAVSLMAFAFVDYAIMYGCIKLVEKLMKRRQG